MVLEADLVLLDCSTYGLKDAQAIKDEVPKSRRRLVCFQEQQPWMDAEEQIQYSKITTYLCDWIRSKATVFTPISVVWTPGDRDLELLRPSIEWLIAPIIELYFPDRHTTAYIHSVGGGLSGTPLVRVEFAGSGSQYYLKFFSDPQEFVTEWDRHKEAKAWLGTSTVDVMGVPELNETGDAQFPPIAGLMHRLEKEGRLPLYPICYQGAKVTTTLKRFYAQCPHEDKILRAYRQVLDVFKLKNDPVLADPDMLYLCLDYGPPPTKQRPPLNSLLQTLRSAPYRFFLDAAIEELGRYWPACNTGLDWHECELHLRELLHDKLPLGLVSQSSLWRGHVHADANSRNFLFNSETPDPSGLQIIDCGCYSKDAPLLFDPAQMESDLKINLMATEERGTFGEIDVHQLPHWIEQEASSIAGPFDFEIPAGVGSSIRRAYRVVRLLRARVRELSPDFNNKPDIRAYYLFLLYWTLRKLRHTSVPHAKRLFALASVFLLYEQLNKQPHP